MAAGFRFPEDMNRTIYPTGNRHFDPEEIIAQIKTDKPSSCNAKVRLMDQTSGPFSHLFVSVLRLRMLNTWEESP